MEKIMGKIIATVNNPIESIVKVIDGGLAWL